MVNIVATPRRATDELKSSCEDTLNCQIAAAERKTCSLKPLSTPVLCVGIGRSEACGSVVRKSQKQLLIGILTPPFMLMELAFVRTENCSTNHRVAAGQLTVAHIRPLASWVGHWWTEACHTTKGGQGKIQRASVHMFVFVFGEFVLEYLQYQGLV